MKILVNMAAVPIGASLTRGLLHYMPRPSQRTSIKGLIVSISWDMGYLKG